MEKDNWVSTSDIEKFNYELESNNNDRFEYKYEITDCVDIDHWNEMGDKGWELLHFRRPSEGGELIWKRKIINE